MLYAIYENDGFSEEDKSPLMLPGGTCTSTDRSSLEYYIKFANIGHKYMYPEQGDNYYYVAECPLEDFMMEAGKPGSRSYSLYRLSDFTPEEQESILAHYAKDGVGDYFQYEDVLGDRSLLHQKSKFESNMAQR